MTREEIEKQCAAIESRHKVGQLAQKYEMDVETPFGNPARVCFWISPDDLKTLMGCFHMAVWPQGVHLNIKEV